MRMIAEHRSEYASLGNSPPATADHGIYRRLLLLGLAQPAPGDCLSLQTREQVTL
jgi:hypothetical protein